MTHDKRRYDKRDATDSAVQFEVERDTVISLTGGDPQPALRIRYREKGQRRWVRFVAVGEDPSDEDLGARGHFLMVEHRKYKQRQMSEAAERVQPTDSGAA